MQRHFDNKRQKEQNEPKIALGSVSIKNEELKISKYLLTDEKIKKNKLRDSEISIPLYNIGTTPISNIVVLIHIKNAQKIIDKFPHTPLDIEVDQIYAKFLENEDKIEYHIISESEGDCYYDEAELEFSASIPALMSGQRNEIHLKYPFDYFAQYFIYQFQYRIYFSKMNNGGWVGGINPKGEIELPVLEVKIKYETQDSKTKEQRFLMAMKPGGFSQKNYLSSDMIHKYEFYLYPIRNQDYNKFDSIE